MKLLGTDQSARDIYLNQNRTKSATEPQMTQHRNTERFFYPVSIRKYIKCRKWRKPGSRRGSLGNLGRAEGEAALYAFCEARGRRGGQGSANCTGDSGLFRSRSFGRLQRASKAFGSYLHTKWSVAWPSNSPWLCSDCETL